ncbi:hypothetical protein B0H65DRAFT_550069 [Neurospora tetraspora]|uniref:Uncharacterized protein n=1 Tax=Neurospora tetraspora TaxID=94610 RepID=A0AAE0JD66_9PEZI|nr:hypothetical protein B0H65DRAFT_550069 [Neurospora tetraspora]
MSHAFFHYLDGEYDQLWEQIREYGAITPSPPAVQQPVRPSNPTNGRNNSSAHYAREYNPFEDQFGQVLKANSPRYSGAPTPFRTPAVTPAGSPPATRVVIPAATAAVSPAVIPATTPAGPSQQLSRSNTRNIRRRQGLWRLYSSFATVFAETEDSQPRREAWARSLINVREILSIDDTPDPQQNSGEASGSSSQDATSGNSRDGRVTRSLLTPDEEEDELRFPQYGS